MKKQLLILIFSLAFITVSSQETEINTNKDLTFQKGKKVDSLKLKKVSRLLRKADTAFAYLSFVEASELYKTIVSKKPTAYVYQQLGDSYYFYGDMKEASKAYRDLFTHYKLSSIASTYYYRYAQSLRGIGDYKKSAVWMKKFHKQQASDRRGVHYTEEEGKESLLLENSNYEVSNLRGINTKYSDFGGKIYRDSILVFASANPNTRWVKRIHTWNNEPFLQLYSVKKAVASDSLSADVSIFSRKLNTIYHESSIAFSNQDSTIYFTRNNYNEGNYKTDKEGTNNLKLYRSVRKRNRHQWGKAVSLPFNSDDYSVGHPTLTQDGKRMYFTSDMPGSIGKTDIFYVDIIQNTSTGAISYSKPMNAGPTINTEGREMFPYISSNGTLYFSSDGHFGLGGLDIFSSESKEGIFQEPKNLRFPVNTKADDFAFMIDEESKQGYLSSNREGGAGGDDIYSVLQTKEDKVPAPLVVEAPVPPCKTEKRGFVRDRDTGELLPHSTVSLIDTTGKVLETNTTGADARFVFKNLQCNQEYRVTGEKPMYKSDVKTFKSEKITESEEVILELGLNDDFVRSSRNDILIKINDIYFDYDKSNIRPDAAIELRKIVEVMRKYPTIIIESGSHTDARGTSAYNQRLSERRALSSVGWIIRQGIDPSRISGRGYGETQLVNGCTDNDRHTNRVKCSKEEHQQNRRTEFKIVNY